MEQKSKYVFDHTPIHDQLHCRCLELVAEFYFSLAPKPSHIKNPHPCLLDPPPKGCAKLNIYGSAMTCPSRAGAGGVIQNHLGGWVRGSSHSLGITNSLMAECWALRDGLMLAYSLGI